MSEYKYKTVTTVTEIEEYVGKSTLVAFDFKTAPDEPYRKDFMAALDTSRAHIVGCSFSVSEGTGIYVPIAHLKGKNIVSADFFAFLRRFLTNRSITKVAHDIAFESSMAYHCGIVIQTPVYDTICASQLTLKSSFEFRKLSDSSLKQLAEELLYEPLPSFSAVTDVRHFDELNAQDARTVRCGCSAADFSLRLYHRFNDWFAKNLPKHRYIVEEIESPTAVYLGIMKHNGLPVNLHLMEERRVEAEAKINTLRKEIESIIGDVPIGASCSTVAFKKYLFEHLRLPVLKNTGAGNEAFDDMALTMLKDWCDKNRPELSHLFTLVLEYRKLGRIKSTFIDGYLKYINPVTGCIHPDIFALSTDTGRMSCQNPNAQNMPRKANDPVGVRNFIKAPDGQIIVSCDFSQIELRVGAFYCRDARMLDTYRNNGDIHAATTSVIFGVSYEEALDKHHPDYKERRTIAKNVNFGTFYGLYAKGLKETLKSKAGMDKSIEECQAILDNLKGGYRGLTSWQMKKKQTPQIKCTRKHGSEDADTFPK